MSKLTILRGVSGSGKSTWAREQNAVVVSRDSIRVMLFGSDGQDYYADERLGDREHTVTLMQDGMISAALRAGKDVIVDNTSVQWKFVKALAKIGYRHGADVEVKVFDVPMGQAFLNVRNRVAMGGRHVPEAVIRQQYESLSKNKSMQLEPVHPVKPYTGTPGKPKAFMYDLDGTVFHMNDKRGPYDINVLVDDVDPVVSHIVREMANDFVPIAMSGRVEAARKDSEFALEFNAVPFNHLFMREDGDMRPDNLIKADLFDMFVRDHYDVQFVIDDRRQVVEMWRTMGLKCLQVEDGDF